MKIIFSIICTVIGLFFSYIVVTFSGFGGQSSVTIASTLLLVFYLIAITYILLRSTKGKDILSAGVLVLPPFLVIIVFVIVSPFYSHDYKHRQEEQQQNYTNLKEECRNAGAQYYKLPTKPVHSIAIGKDIHHHFPFFEYYETENDGKENDGKFVKISTKPGLGGNPLTLPDQIEFTECIFGDGGFLRRPPYPQGDGYRIDKWSADIMVEYQVIRLRKFYFFKTDIYKNYLIIKDRRNGDVLARLLYVVDKKNWFACGFTGNVIDEKYFVLKAIGLEK